METTSVEEKVKAENQTRQSESRWSAAVDRFSNRFAYGDTVPKSWFYSQFDLKEPDKNTSYVEGKEIELKFLACFAAFHALLLNRYQMLLSPVIGKGYEVIKPKEQTAHVENKGMKKIGKELNKSLFRLQSINFAMLSENEKKENADAVCRMSMIKQMHKEQKKQIKIRQVPFG